MKKFLDTNNLLTAVFVILTVLVITIFLRDKQLILQGFTAEEQENNKIRDEIDKQVRLMNEFKFPNPTDLQNSVIKVMPNMEIIHKYRDNANTMLGPIEETVKKDVIQKQVELDKLNDYVMSLNEYAKRDFMNKMSSRDIRTIKSHNNGLEIAVNKSPDDTQPNYQVHINNGCLKVPYTNDITVAPCNSADPDQIFSLDRVFNEAGYRAKLDPAFPQLQDLGEVRYPFSILRSKTNGNCIKNFHGNISVEPCREYEGQRWAESEKSCGT